MKKRLLSFVLAALMIASLLPATALAANIVDSGTCGAEVTWTLDSEGVLTISGSGYMYDNGSSASGAPWYGSRSRVKSAVIADGVTSIGVYAFYDCTSLTSVTIPDSVTSIGSGAFSHCKSLTSVTIPDSVTSIGGAAFNGCSSLTSVTIPDSVTSIGGEAFFNCTSLTSVTIPNSVTSIGEYAFSDCSSLTSVTIPDSVTSIVNGAFAGCRSLTSVTIPDSVTSIDWSAFAGCRSLTSVTIPDSVTSIGDGAFSYCESLTSVTIPDSVTSIGGTAFNDCSSLTSVTIPDSVTSIGVQAFWGCTSLTSVTIPNGVTSIGALAFSNCKSLTSVTIPDSVTSIGEWAFSGCDNLTDVYYTGTEIAWNKIKISDNNDALKNAAIHYFSEWTREKEPTCTEPGSETSVCPEAGCGKTFTREIPALGHSWDEGKVTKPATEAETGVKTFTCTRCGETRTETMPVIPHVHSYKDVVTAPTCTEKGYTTHTCACGDSYVDTYVDALGHAWDNGEVTKQPTETEPGVKAFTCTRCGETKTEVIPATGIVASGTCGAEGDGSNLTWTLDSDGVLTISGTGAMKEYDPYKAPWYGSSSRVKSAVIAEGVTSIGGKAFLDCTSLTSVTIPDSVTSIGKQAFMYCTSLTGVTIPDSVTSIGGAAFNGCSSLASVTIPNSVTSIGGAAFNGCSSLTSVTIPDSVTSINNGAFYDCSSLTDVYYAGSEAQWKAISISSNRNDDLLTANIHYNYGSHTHSYKDVVTAPTCTEKGYTTHTCACGDSYVDTYTNALGHAWDNGKVTKEPTETETGVKTFTCTRCGETKTETIPATGSDVDVTEMFSDVTKNWAYPGIQYCVTHKLMGSTGGDKFAPTMTTTRAQIVQILYNLEGEPKVSGTTPFTDLTQDWYQDAVLWAYQTGVVAGTGDGTTFDPDLPVTREQIAVILMEYTDRILNIKRTWTPADLSGFPDAGSVSDWAKDAMADAVGLGLISGASNGGQTYLNPQGSATREQVATILMEFCKNVKK